MQFHSNIPHHVWRITSNLKNDLASDEHYAVLSAASP